MPVPGMLLITGLVFVARDVLDTVTAHYTWTPQTGDIYGWDLPPLLVSVQVLSSSPLIWLGAPLSLIVRTRRELPVRVQQVLVCRGVPERDMMRSLVRSAMVHVLLFWLFCCVLAGVLTALFCNGKLDTAYLDQIIDAGVVLPPRPLPLSCAALAVSTLVPPLLTTLLALAVLQMTGNAAAACVIAPVMYLARAILPSVFQMMPPLLSSVADILLAWISPFFTCDVVYAPPFAFTASLAMQVGCAAIWSILLTVLTVRFNRAIVRRRLW